MADEEKERRFPDVVIADSLKLGVNYGVLETAPESDYSCLMPYQLPQVETAFQKEVQAPPKRIIDATANVGADTLNFQRMYPGAAVVALEADPHTASLLRRNAARYAQYNVRRPPLVPGPPGPPIEVVEGDCLAYFAQARAAQAVPAPLADIIYLDPPWGGRRRRVIRLTLSGQALGAVVRDALQYAPLVVVKLPEGADVAKFQADVGPARHKTYDIVRPTQKLARASNVAFQLHFVRPQAESTGAGPGGAARPAVAALAIGGRTTLESLVTTYRREASGRANAELEVRFQNLDYDTYVSIVDALAAAGPGRQSRIISALKESGRGERGAMLQSTQIREMHFVNGKADTRYVSKTPLILPYRVAGAGLPYIVALASEAPCAAFVSDGRSQIRFKARTSFDLEVPASAGAGAGAGAGAFQWRVDATVTREAQGSGAPTAIKAIKAQMFDRPGEFLEALGLRASEAARAPYRFELEVEFAAPPGQRDALRPSDVTAAAERILGLANPEFLQGAALQAEVYAIARYVASSPEHALQFEHDQGLKRLLPKVLPLTRGDYVGLYPPRGCYLTDKADGERAVAVARGTRAVVVASELHEYAAKGAKPAKPRAAETIVDGEFYQGRFYAFDVIAVGGVKAAGDFEARLAALPAAVAELVAAGVPAEAKPYTRVPDLTSEANLEAAFRGVLEAKRPYLTDGLILVEPGEGYAATVSRKWKPPVHNTIDFLARRAPPSILGKAPYLPREGHTLMLLFVGVRADAYEALGMTQCPGYADLFGQGRRGPYFPVHFSPPDTPWAYLYYHPDGPTPAAAIEGKVVECRRLPGPGPAPRLVGWELLRVREDRRRDLAAGRYYGNDALAAEKTWLNYLDPLPPEELWRGPAGGYFGAKGDSYRAQTAALSYMKSLRIQETLGGAQCVVDCAAGRGQDLGRYRRAKVQKLYAIDKDRSALAELVNRHHGFARARGPPSRLELRLLAADATEDAKVTAERLELLNFHQREANALVCNLAVHYFLGTEAGLKNFVALAQRVVRPGGRVIITAMIGERVHGLFTKAGIAPGGRWERREAGVLKFALERRYVSPALEAAGQRIGVLLPFSGGELYEEYLVNMAAMTAAFEGRGFRLEERRTMESLLPEFESRNRTMSLTPADREYLSLYGELCFVQDK